MTSAPTRTAAAHPRLRLGGSVAAGGEVPLSWARSFVGRRYLKLVLVLGLMRAIGPLTIDTYLPALPELTAEMHATTSQSQLTITGLLLGLGLGQLIIGPLSDSVGRRRPLLFGLLGHGAMSVLCALAPSIAPARGHPYPPGPGRGGCGGGRHGGRPRPVHRRSRRPAAVAADPGRRRGTDPGSVARECAAPLHLLAGHLRRAGDRGGRSFVLALVALPETLPASRRSSVSLRGSLRAYSRLFSDRLFVVMVLVAGLLFATLFAYISGAPFILQGLFGLSPQQFGLAFGANAVGLIVMTQLNPMFVVRYGPVRVIRSPGWSRSREPEPCSPPRSPAGADSSAS